MDSSETDLPTPAELKMAQLPAKETALQEDVPIKKHILEEVSESEGDSSVSSIDSVASTREKLMMKMEDTNGQGFAGEYIVDAGYVMSRVYQRNRYS